MITAFSQLSLPQFPHSAAARSCHCPAHEPSMAPHCSRESKSKAFAIWPPPSEALSPPRPPAALSLSLDMRAAFEALQNPQALHSSCLPLPSSAPPHQAFLVPQTLAAIWPLGLSSAHAGSPSSSSSPMVSSSVYMTRLPTSHLQTLTPNSTLRPNCLLFISPWAPLSSCPSVHPTLLKIFSLLVVFLCYC